MAGVSAAMEQETASAFNPVRDGQQASDGDVVYIYASDFAIDAVVSNDAEAYLWVEMTADNCYIRVSELHEDSATINNWYNTAGVGQGDPGAYPTTSTIVYTLGEQPDSINIYTVSTTTTTGAPSFTAIGSYTDDNQTTFFSPVLSTKYGKYVRSATVAGPGFDVDVEQGEFRMKFTFRKAGYDDVEVEFIAHSRSLSTSEL
jgi:hypothetical protein